MSQKVHIYGYIYMDIHAKSLVFGNTTLMSNMASTSSSQHELVNYITDPVDGAADDRFVAPSISDGDDPDSDSEEIDISELKKRMWKNQMLLRKLEGSSSKEADGDIVQCDNPLHCSLQNRPLSSRKTLQRAEDGVLRCMLKLMQDSDTRGFVYGILPKTGPPITGSSDSLRSWWKDSVGFERTAPLALMMDPAEILPVIEQNLESYLYKLQDMNDNTIGSILSALIQHCAPPQKSFPFDQRMAPPWWPSGEEAWWGLQGQPHALLGPPPYRKPHDLRKGWKLSLLAAVIKHMSPSFNQMRNLVGQSKRLQLKMSAKDVNTWSKVLNQEEALVEQTKKSLVIAPLDDHDDNDGADDDTTVDSRQKRPRHDMYDRGGNWSGWNGDLEAEYNNAPNEMDFEVNYSINELMRMYSQESSSGDLGALF